MIDDQTAPAAIQADEATDLVAGFPIFESVPREEIGWLIGRGELRSYASGDALRRTGTAINEMDILVTGRVGLFLERGGSWRRILSVGPGYVAGAVPYSRMRTAPGTLVVEEDATVFSLNVQHFRDLIVECPNATAALVHQMLDRAREFRTMAMQDERLLALGKLASGLAHELNNPASGASSGARSLATMLDDADAAARALAAARLTDAQLEAVDRFREECGRAAPDRGALETADREDDLTDWLESHEVDPTYAEVLAASDLSLEALDALAEALPPETLAVAIRWVATGTTARDVARHIRTATSRIHDMVDSVKGFTFMDREGAPEEVDIARGIAHTLTMLESRSSAKAVDVRVETADDLPRVYGYGSEINQVWQALIENAIDAVDREGSVTVTASARDGAIVVRVADNGPGIPDENHSRVFDPFFTTKPVGSGPGLGLYRARRTIDLHHGDLELTSKPGRTVFRVRLPAAGIKASGRAPGGGTG